MISDGFSHECSLNMNMKIVAIMLLAMAIACVPTTVEGQWVLSSQLIVASCNTTGCNGALLFYIDSASPTVIRLFDACSYIAWS